MVWYLGYNLIKVTTQNSLVDAKILEKMWEFLHLYCIFCNVLLCPIILYADNQYAQCNISF